jgi:hypothetical protein
MCKPAGLKPSCTQHKPIWLTKEAGEKVLANTKSQHSEFLVYSRDLIGLRGQSFLTK